MNNFTDLVNRRTAQYGDKFDVSDLDKRFIAFYQNGQRIKVETCGMVMTGTVGVTTGWKPAFLLMRTSRSMGSSWILGTESKLLSVQASYKGKYIAVNNK
jgi:hypothetical protein